MPDYWKRKYGKYGLIGHPLGHSLSPQIHEAIMKKTGITGSYELYEISPDEFESRVEQLLQILDGINITIPYKSQIIPFLADIDGLAKDFDTVNTVAAGKGYSTDIAGLIKCDIPFTGANVLILGAGGAAGAALAASILEGAARIGIWSRREEQAQVLLEKPIEKRRTKEVFYEPDIGVKSKDTVLYKKSKKYYDVIINATPLGMWPLCGMPPLSDEIIMHSAYVFDMVYNPLATRLLLKAGAYGVPVGDGLEMLVNQAIEAQRLWNPDALFTELSYGLLSAKLKYTLLDEFDVKIVLSGFMGSGKSTAGRALAEALKVDFFDLDDEIRLCEDMSISQIFEDFGEEYFRKSETAMLEKIMKSRGSAVVALGGGAAVSSGNMELIKENCGFVFFLNADFEVLMQRISGDPGRPLIQNRSQEKIRYLWNSRLPIYIKEADYVVDANSELLDVVAEIKKVLGF